MTAPDGPIRVLLADDQDLVRVGFKMLLETEDDITVVAEAATGAQAITLARAHRPHVGPVPEASALMRPRATESGAAASGTRECSTTTKHHPTSDALDFGQVPRPTFQVIASVSAPYLRGLVRLNRLIVVSRANGQPST